MVLSEKSSPFLSKTSSRASGPHKNKIETYWRVSIRATQEHKTKIMAMVEASGTSASAIIRQLIEHGSVKINPAINMKAWSEMGPLLGNLYIMRKQSEHTANFQVLSAVNQCIKALKDLRRDLIGSKDE